MAAGARREVSARLGTRRLIDGFESMGCDGSRIECPRARELERRLGKSGKNDAPPAVGGGPGRPIGQDDRKRGPRGYDSGKKVAGRKRHILVDTIGLLMCVVVHAADVQDRDGAKLLLAGLARRFGRLRLIWADGGYAGKLVEWVRGLRRRGRLRLEIVKRSDDAKGFVVLPRRWVVERTFAWLGRWRRLSKDYEATLASSEAMVKLAAIHMMARRLARKGLPRQPLSSFVGFVARCCSSVWAFNPGRS